MLPFKALLTSLRSEVRLAIDEYHKNGVYLIKILAAAGAPVAHYEKVLGGIISETEKAIDNLFEGKKLTFTWKAVWEQLNSLRDSLYKESESILSSAEFKVLYSIISRSRASPWMLFAKLIDQISNEYRSEKADVDRHVRALIQKGLLREGGSFAI